MKSGKTIRYSVARMLWAVGSIAMFADSLFDLGEEVLTSNFPRAIFSTIMMSRAATSSRFAESFLLLWALVDSFKPASWFIWEQIRDWFDIRIKNIGVRNCAFPLFVSEEVLQREKAHIEGFAAEVAWVTHA